VYAHVNSFFRGHSSVLETFERGPIGSLVPGFHVIVLEPGPKTACWTYISVGCGVVGDGSSRLELVAMSGEEEPILVERLAMVTHYHARETLGVGHSLPVGEPWTPGSTLEHLLVSLPYPFGEDLELMTDGDEHVHFLWLLPITAAEREYKNREGLEALEELFDQRGIEYSDPNRRSVV
jgi:hypothetical protein